MAFLWKVILKFAANAGALFVATRYIEGFKISPQALLNLNVIGIPPFLQIILAGGIVLAILNDLARPLLKIIAAILPLITFVILAIAFNFAVLYVADIYLNGLTILGVKPLFLASLLIGVINSIF